MSMDASLHGKVIIITLSVSYAKCVAVTFSLPRMEVGWLSRCFYAATLIHGNSAVPPGGYR